MACIRTTSQLHVLGIEPSASFSPLPIWRAEVDRPTAADALYLLTEAVASDGGEKATTEAIGRLISTSVRLYAVLLTETGVRFPNDVEKEILGHERLAEMARRSGGGILSRAWPDENRLRLSAGSETTATTEEILMHLYQAILQDSVLEFEISFPLKKNESFELKLSDTARRQWKNARLFYSKELTGCESSVPN